LLDHAQVADDKTNGAAPEAAPLDLAPAGATQQACLAAAGSAAD
jgi:hypothetical protein